MNQSETVPNVSFPLGSFPHSRRHQNAVNGPMPLTSFLPFCLLGPEVCVDPARAAGLSSPAVIISQVSYWAADWLIGDGSFFPSLSFIGLFFVFFFLLSIVLDFCLSTGQLPSLPLSAAFTKTRTDSLRLDEN